jgi:hypothetical protein
MCWIAFQLRFPENDVLFVATMMYCACIHKEDIPWTQISRNLLCSLDYPCLDYLVCRLSLHDCNLLMTKVESVK